METPEELIENWRLAVREMTALQSAAYAVAGAFMRRTLDVDLALTKEQCDAERQEWLAHPATVALREARAKVKSAADAYNAFRRASVNG